MTGRVLRSLGLPGVDYTRSYADGGADAFIHSRGVTTKATPLTMALYGLNEKRRLITPVPILSKQRASYVTLTNI